MAIFEHAVAPDPQPTPQASAGAAHRALLRLERGVLTGALDAPADGYAVIGSLGRVAATLQASLAAQSAWWAGEAGRDALRAESGPFAGDPGAAADVTAQALAAAVTACEDLRAALERAQMASADLAPADPLAPPAVRRPFWRR